MSRSLEGKGTLLWPIQGLDDTKDGANTTKSSLAPLTPHQHGPNGRRLVIIWGEKKERGKWMEGMSRTEIALSAPPLCVHERAHNHIMHYLKFRPK